MILLHSLNLRTVSSSALNFTETFLGLSVGRPLFLFPNFFTSLLVGVRNSIVNDLLLLGICGISPPAIFEIFLTCLIQSRTVCSEIHWKGGTRAMIHKQEVESDRLTLDEASRLMFLQYPDVLDVNQMCEMLGIGKKAAYHLLRTNQIGYFKEGRLSDT